MRDAIPFIVEADHTMMAFVDSDGKKTGLCFAQITCRVAQKSGTTELVLCDHDLTQQVDTDPKVCRNNLFAFPTNFLQCC